MEVEHIAGNLNASFKATLLCKANNVLDLFQLRNDARACRVLTKLSHKFCRILQVGNSILRSVCKESVELVSAPFNAMLNLVGEVAECAHGNRLFRRVLRVAVALGLVRDYHL